MLPVLPHAKSLLGDSHREVQLAHDAAFYRHRHKIEIMFGRLKDWCRIQPSTIDPPTLMSAMAITGTVILLL